MVNLKSQLLGFIKSGRNYLTSKAQHPYLQFLRSTFTSELSWNVNNTTIYLLICLPKNISCVAISQISYFCNQKWSLAYLKTEIYVCGGMAWKIPSQEVQRSRLRKETGAREVRLQSRSQPLSLDQKPSCYRILKQTVWSVNSLIVLCPFLKTGTHWCFCFFYTNRLSCVPASLSPQAKGLSSDC